MKKTISKAGFLLFVKKWFHRIEKIKKKNNEQNDKDNKPIKNTNPNWKNFCFLIFSVHITYIIRV